MVIAPPGSQIPKRFTSDMRLLLAREPPALLQCPRVVEKPFPPGRLPWPRTRHRIFLRRSRAPPRNSFAVWAWFNPRP